MIVFIGLIAVVLNTMSAIISIANHNYLMAMMFVVGIFLSAHLALKD